MGLRVLLAEDNAINQKVAQRMLEKLGCQVDVVGDGTQALAAWARTPYDVVLMDVQMPVMDGLEAAAEIRRREAGSARHTPIVALTANAMEGDDQRCLAAGIDDYVSKPVDAGRLRTVLGRSAGSATPATPRAPQPPVQSVFDSDRFEEICGEDPKFRREVLLDFLSRTPEVLASIETSIVGANAPELTRASHSLKGSSLTLGANAFGSVCQELETMGDTAVLGAARETLVRAQREFARLRTVLSVYVATALPDRQGVLPTG